MTPAGRPLRLALVALASLAALPACRHITVYEDPVDDGPSTSGGGDAGAGAPPSGCRELLWDRDEPIALDPLYGVQGPRALAVSADGVKLVSLRFHPDGTSTVVTTHIADAWGESFTVAEPLDRGLLDEGSFQGPAWWSSLHAVTRSDGALAVFRVLPGYNAHESVTLRLDLPADDGPAVASQELASTFAVSTLASGRAVLARLETLSEGGGGWPWEQRLILSDAETGLALFDSEGQLFVPGRVVSGVGRGVYLEVEESEDYDEELPKTFRSWMVFDDGFVERDFSAYESFARTASGSVAVDARRDVVALSDEGVPGDVLFSLPWIGEGLVGSSGILPWRDEHALVTLRSVEGEEAAALEVRATGDAGSSLTSPPLASRRAGSRQVLLGPDGQSLLVAYERWPAEEGVWIARLVCRGASD